MSFDPYYEWLGIPSHEQPPNFYRLLGLAVFEANSSVIANAADRQMAHLRTRQIGPNAALAQRLLNELSAARVCLLDPDKKAKYDEQLMFALGGLGPVSTGSSPGAAAPVNTAGESRADVSPRPVASIAPIRGPSSHDRPALTSKKATRPKPATAKSVMYFIQIVFGGIAGIAVSILVLKLVFKKDPFDLFSESTPVARQTSTPPAPLPAAPAPSARPTPAAVPERASSPPAPAAPPSVPAHATASSTTNTDSSGQTTLPALREKRKAQRSSSSANAPQPSAPPPAPTSTPAPGAPTAPATNSAPVPSPSPAPAPAPPPATSPAPAVTADTPNAPAPKDLATADYVALPPCGPPEDSSAAAQAVVLGLLPIDDGDSQPQLALRTDFVRLKQGESFDLIARQQAGVWRWVVAHYATPDKSNPQKVAEFQRGDQGQLLFTWGIRLSKEVAEQLRNCLLAISWSGKQNELALRRPATWNSLTLNLDVEKEVQAIDLEDMPRAEELYFEMIRVDGPGQATIKNDRRSRRLGDKLRLEFAEFPECWADVALLRRSGGSLSLSVEPQFGLSGRQEHSLSFPHLKELRESLPKLAEKSERERVAAVAKATEAARIAQSAAAGSPAQRTAAAAAKSQASTADSHARRIVEIRKTIAALDKFDHAASQLHHNTRLVYRVLAKNDQRQLVLVDTEADRTAHVP